jgi:hypothetical protein
MHQLVPSSSGGSTRVWLGYIHVQVMCFCEMVTKKKVARRKNRRCAFQLNHSNPFNELSRHLGTPNRINATDVASLPLLRISFTLVVRAPPPLIITLTPHTGAVCLVRIGSRKRPDPSQRRTSVE